MLLLGPFFLLTVIFLLGILTVYILFLVNLQKTLASCSAHNRAIAPGLVWLNLIPFFGYVWPFILNPMISKSIRQELEERQGPSDYDNYAMTWGLVYPSLVVVSAAIRFTSLNLWIVNLFLSLAILTTMVVYWMKTADYRKQIRSLGDPIFAKNDLLDGI